MKKISLLHLLNFIVFLIVIIAIFVSYYSFLEKYNVNIVLYIGLIIFTDVFLYNHIYLWIVSKSKNSNIWKFFSTWGRREIREKINDYFDGKYIQIYNRTITLSYILLIFNMILLVSIPIYLTNFYNK